MSPQLIQIHQADPAAIRAELIAGLSAPVATIAPKYFYDALGARLFAAITELPEYYPTRTEAAIFVAHADAMACRLPAFETFVDLGAGNCEKAARLFAPFHVKRYVAVDISVDYLRDSLDILRRQHPHLALLGIGLDFSAALQLPEEVGAGPRLMFYPGSSIGNFTPDAALDFLRQVHGAAQGGGLLIGVDLVKPVAVLEAAYDDPLQVTAAFNRNMLRHVSRLASADFSLADWQHVAFFNTAASRIEMHLQAVRDVTVRWPEGARQFSRGERIHTENSYKWRIEDFAALLTQAGFHDLQHWTDTQGWFAVFLAKAN
ncbi:MAG: L-histidine N(alpha)-methyltransferase [Rhodocyclaceae bacterium]|nr:L-histidine N(alpha)-methyltransferase [Rhodocyclaceae bacterium]MDZ4214526.1 L-histidine N(alpha)-methyltransferase [Rhodocyclaceae bacterium]